MSTTLPQCSHISRKRGIYYYRRRIPGSGSQEIAISLRTRMYREAEWLAQDLDVQLLRVLGSVDQINKKTDIEAVIRSYLKQRLDFDLARRAQAPGEPIYGIVDEPGETLVSVDLAWIESELRTARSELANRLYEHQQPLIDAIMEEHGVPVEYWNAVAHGILRANVDLWDTIRRRTLGEFPRIEIAPSRPTSAPAQPNRPQAPDAGPKLSEVLPSFIAFMKKNDGWRGQTLAQNQASYRMFIECCGDRPVQAYERRDLTRFYDILRGLPALYSKKKDWRGKPIAVIAEETAGLDVERLAMQTVIRVRWQFAVGSPRFSTYTHAATY